MAKVIWKGRWKDDDPRWKDGWPPAAGTISLNEPTLTKGQWVSVSVPLAGEIVTINIGPRRWKRICDGEWVHSLTSRFNFDGEDVLLYWTFNLQTRYEVAVNDYQKTVTRRYRIFVGSLTDAHIQLTDPPKRQRPKSR